MIALDAERTPKSNKFRIIAQGGGVIPGVCLNDGSFITSDEEKLKGKSIISANRQTIDCSDGIIIAIFDRQLPERKVTGVPLFSLDTRWLFFYDNAKIARILILSDLLACLCHCLN